MQKGKTLIIEQEKRRAEPEEWLVQWMDGDYLQSKHLKTVKGRDVVESDWICYVEQVKKLGRFFGATKI